MRWQQATAMCLLIGLSVTSGRTSMASEPSGVVHATSDEFTDVAGKKYRFPTSDKCQAMVLLFIGHDCPISNSYAKEISRYVKQFAPRNVAFCVIYADADLGREAAGKHATEYGYSCPAILDPQMKLARQAGATVKPEVAVLSPKSEVLYRGRIDDRYVDFGKQRAQVTSHDLRDALEAILANKPVATPRTQALGCDIDFPVKAK